MQATIKIHKGGRRIVGHAANGLDYVGPEGLTGTVKGYQARAAILVSDPRLPGRLFRLTPEDCGGPAMIRIERGESVEWIALATAEQVASAGGRVQRVAVDRSRAGEAAEPFTAHPALRPGGLAAEVRPGDVRFPFQRHMAPVGTLWRQWQNDLQESRRRQRVAR